ncbi:MAG: hypothetical protein QXT63_06830 [Thermoplasmata archaeon]
MSVDELSSFRGMHFSYQGLDEKAWNGVSQHSLAHLAVIFWLFAISSLIAPFLHLSYDPPDFFLV